MSAQTVPLMVSAEWLGKRMSLDGQIALVALQTTDAEKLSGIFARVMDVLAAQPLTAGEQLHIAAQMMATIFGQAFENVSDDFLQRALRGFAELEWQMILLERDADKPPEGHA